MRFFVLVFCFILAACSPVTQTVTADKPLGVKTYASVGDVIARFGVKESLPNIAGNADIWGRTRDRGFSEVRYMGIGPSGQPVFRRRDVDILTNETTMSRSGLATSVSTTQPTAQGTLTTGIGTRPQLEVIQPLPPDTLEFSLDLAQSRIITVREHAIEVVEASPAGVTFILR